MSEASERQRDHLLDGIYGLQAMYEHTCPDVCIACDLSSLIKASEDQDVPHRPIEILRARVEELEGIARFLFDRLDDIDTASDMAKDDNVGYRKLVESIQARRFEVADTDGYTVTWKALKGARDGTD